jgi:hypothetical protein
MEAKIKIVRDLTSNLKNGVILNDGKILIMPSEKIKVFIE